MHRPAAGTLNRAGQSAPANNFLTVEGVVLGRQLVHETVLLANNAVACACHQQARAFSNGLARSVNVQGTSITRSPCPGNLVWEPTLTLNGTASTLEAQVRIPSKKPVGNVPTAGRVAPASFGHTPDVVMQSLWPWPRHRGPCVAGHGPIRAHLSFEQLVLPPVSAWQPIGPECL